MGSGPAASASDLSSASHAPQAQPAPALRFRMSQWPVPMRPQQSSRSSGPAHMPLSSATPTDRGPE